jgi:hypothetical protein
VLYLIEVAIEAALEVIVHFILDEEAGLVPETRELARLVVLIAGLEIEVSAGALPQNLVLLGLERRRLVEITLESD